MKRILPFAIALLAGCGHIANEAGDNDVKIRSVSEVHWAPLNPARGDKGPQAATLWGNREGKAATGFLVKFVDGFSSPPHVHNVSYRGIVIDGLLHNDDPGAANLWMPRGSYWTQPAGEAHITSAKGERNMAFIEIDSGPYLVKPEKSAFDNGERPFNIHADNIIWRDQGDGKIAGPKITGLWKNKADRVTGSMLRFKGPIQLEAEAANLVLIEGGVTIRGRTLSPGSLISLGRKSKIAIACAGEGECILYVKSDEKFRVL